MNDVYEMCSDFANWFSYLVWTKHDRHKQSANITARSNEYWTKKLFSFGRSFELVCRTDCGCIYVQQQNEIGRTKMQKMLEQQKIAQILKGSNNILVWIG